MGEKLRQSDIAEQDLFGQVVKSAKELTLVLDKTNKEINETVTGLAKIASTASADSQKGINKIVAAQKKMNTEFVKAQKIEKDTIKNSKALQKARLDELRLQKQREQAFDKFEKQQQRNLKQQQRAKKATLDSVNAYKRLSSQVNNASARLKRMAAQYGLTDKRTIQAQKNFDRLDKKLRGVNNAARDGRRDVGRYGLALQGVRGAALRMAAALGIAGGGFMAFRKIGSVIVDFNQAQTDLAAISQRSTEELAQFEKQARELGATTQFTATEITGLQLELAKLGFTTDEILNSTGGISNFAAATGVEIPRAAKVAGSALRAFGLDATEIDRVVSTLGVATTKSALDFGFLETALSTVAPVANAMGFSIEDTTALLSQLADSGFDASTSATATRNILLNLADANGDLAKELGRPITSAGDLAGALQELDAKGIDLATTLELTDKRSVAAFNTFLNGADKLSETKDSITDVNDELEKMADDRLDSVQGQWALLQSALEGYILDANEAGGVTNKLKTILGFLAENLSTILNVLFKVVAVVVQFKLAMKALKIYQNIGGLKGLGKAFKSIGGGAKTATSQTKKLGKALKGIGFGLAVTAGLELLKLLWDLASGTAELRRQEDLLAAARKVSAEAVDKVTKPLDRQIKEEKKKLELDLAKGNIKQLEFEQKMKVLEEKKLKRLTAERDLRAKQIVEIEKKNAALKKEKEARNVDAKDFAMSESGQRSYENAVDRVNRANAESNRLIEKNNRLIVFKQEAEKDFAEAIDNTSDAIHDYTVNIADHSAALDSYTSEVKTTTDAVDDLTRAYKDLSELDIQGILDAGQSLEDIEDEEISAENNRIARSLSMRLTLINNNEAERVITAEEAANLRKVAQIEALEEQKAILVLYGRDVVEIDEQLSQLRLDLVGNVKDETVESYKDLYKKLEELGNKALDKEVERSQKKQKLLDDEIDKSQQLEDRLREGAANGNAIASESLAEQSSITEQKTREKLSEAKREQRIEELKALWAALNNFLQQGDSLPKAGGKATAGVFSLKQIFSNLTGFATGTKGRLKDEHKAQFGGVDGHVVRVDDEEAILTGGKMDRLAAAGLHTTDDIVNSAIMNQQLMGVPMANGIDDRTGSVNNELIGEVKKLSEIMKGNKPVRMHPVFKQGMLDAIVEQQGNKRNWNYRK
tara:strand:- start:2712 stop:6212 length:3501 start_codon:yes stop_codon:yes gene_type:complete